MSQKTITLSPQAWAVRGGGLDWTTGGAGMLAAVDADVAVCNNPANKSADSKLLDATTFTNNATAALPVFEVDARNPILTVRCYLGTGDTPKSATPIVTVFDSANMGAAEVFNPMAVVSSDAWIDRGSAWANTVGNSMFDALAAGRFVVSTLFQSRPFDPTSTSKNLRWNAAELVLAYTYGPNTTPAPFDFVNAAGVASANVLSNVVNITGIDTPQAVSVTGTAVFSVNGDAFSATPRNISNGQTLQIRMAAPAVVGNSVSTTVTVETRTDVWQVTAGTTVPSSVSTPLDLVNNIPGWLVPDAIINLAQVFAYSISGNTIPMPFSFAWSSNLSGLQYSQVSSNGPWTDGALPGSKPAGSSSIWVRVRAPGNPATTGTVTLTHPGGTDVVNVSTGAIGYVYAVDLSPIDNFPVAMAGTTQVWSPTPAGTNAHASVAQTTIANGVPFANVNSNLNAGRWWRRVDTQVMAFPVGTKLKGVGYGGHRDHIYAFADPTAVVETAYAMDPAGSTWTLLAGTDNAQTDNTIAFVAGDVTPGVTPTGWALDALLVAIQNDTFQLGKRTQLADTAGFTPVVRMRTILLRVFFEVVRPPEGMIWEI